MLRLCALTSLVGTTLAFSAPAQCVWGSFDGTRINYAAGPLLGTAHSTLRGLITGSSATVGTATSTLTPTYLATVNVFYTSLLSGSTGALSTTEQTALQNWVNAGGILVVTSDYGTTTAYDSVTKWLGVSYTATRWTGVGSITASHPVTTGITAFYCAAGASFNVPTGAKLLGQDTSSRPFMAVFDPTSTQKGAVLITGDHNMFTDSYIGNNDNRALAANIVRWACCANTKASQSNYCTGLAGKNGVPTLTATANPVNNTTIIIVGANSSGAATSGLLAVGLSTISVPFLGGTLCTSLDLELYTAVSSTGLGLQVKIPATELCGIPIHLQLLQLDSAAAQGVSMSPGLKLIPGN